MALKPFILNGLEARGGKFQLFFHAPGPGPTAGRAAPRDKPGEESGQFRRVWGQVGRVWGQARGAVGDKLGAFGGRPVPTKKTLFFVRIWAVPKWVVPTPCFGCPLPCPRSKSATRFPNPRLDYAFPRLDLERGQLWTRLGTPRGQPKIRSFFFLSRTTRKKTSPELA